MSHAVIRQLFETRLSTWSALQGLRVAYEGVEFEPATDETYLRAFMLPAGTHTQTLEGDSRVYTGVFQINVVSASGHGTGYAEGIVEALDELFPVFLRLRRDDFEVLVLTPIEPGPPVIADSTLTVAASFQYRADHG